MATVEAVIVAGGLGSRLWPLTEHTPKPLLPVAGVPFVAHQLAKLAIAGVDCVVLATGYQAGQFERALGDGARWGIDLVHVAEPEPLGTAGAIRNAASHLTSGPSDPVVVLNSDILSGHDLTAQLNAHCQSDADVTLHLVEVPDARAYGCVSIDDTGRVQEFLEKSANPRSHLVNAGCYVFRRQVIDAIPASRAVSVERETFPGLVSGSAVVRGHRDDSYWRDLGTPAALVHASADLVTGVAASPAYQRPPGQSCIDPDAECGRADVGGGSSLGPGVAVGAGTVVWRSVVYAGVRIGAGCIVRDSVVGPRARIGSDSTLVGAAVGDGAHLGRRCELVAGARVGCEVRLPDAGLRFSGDPGDTAVGNPGATTE